MYCSEGIILRSMLEVNSSNFSFFFHYLFITVQFSCSVLSASLWPQGLQHARPPCPSPTPRVYSNSCPLSQWCHPTISSSVVPFSSCLQSFPAWVFDSESALCIWWPKYWSFSFSISPSREYSGLIPLGWTGWISLQFHLKCAYCVSLIKHESIFWPNGCLKTTLTRKFESSLSKAVFPAYAVLSQNGLALRREWAASETDILGGIFRL